MTPSILCAKYVYKNLLALLSELPFGDPLDSSSSVLPVGKSALSFLAASADSSDSLVVFGWLRKNLGDKIFVEEFNTDKFIQGWIGPPTY